LKPADKNFYPLNDYNYAMIPDSKIDKNIQVVIFNKKRKKYRKVLYEKNLDETVNNYDISLEDSLIRENNQIKIVWKEFQNNYINIDDLPENMLYLPTIEDLKKAGEENYNENNGYEIENNIYNNDNQNVFREGRNKKHKKDDSFKPPTFTDQEKFEQIQDTNDNNLIINESMLFSRPRKKTSRKKINLPFSPCANKEEYFRQIKSKKCYIRNEINIPYDKNNHLTRQNSYYNLINDRKQRNKKLNINTTREEQSILTETENFRKNNSMCSLITTTKNNEFK